MSTPSAAFAMRPDLPTQLFSDPVMRQLQQAVRIDPEACLTSFVEAAAGATPLSSIELLITGWGCPSIDASTLDLLPSLRAIVHSGGTVKTFLSQDCWDRGIRVSTAANINAIPVAEYTVAMILLAGKGVSAYEDRYRAERQRIDFIAEAPPIGNCGRRVGIIGASRVGRRVLELLRPYDYEISLYDPKVSEDQAKAWGAHLAGLDDVVRTSEILSIHAPAISSTHHLIDARLLAMLPAGATLINTARGALVDQGALERELVQGRIRAVLDVVSPHDLLAQDSPLWDLPNVILTPHMAGAAGNELVRLGRHVLDEVGRFVDGRQFLDEVSAADLAIMA